MINPRLSDAFDLSFTQDEVDFLIPHMHEDLPLCIDPFLLWKSDHGEFKSLHSVLVSFFDVLRKLAVSGHQMKSLEMLLKCREAREIGLGYAKGSKAGQAIGPQLAQAILAIFPQIPQLRDEPLSHIEAIQLLVPGVREDRISDITASILKPYLLTFTRARAHALRLPTRPAIVPDLWDEKTLAWQPGKSVDLPYNPTDGSPILLVPLAWLRHLPWINYDDYYRSYYAKYVLPPDWSRRKVPNQHVLAFNRANYRETQQYIKQKEDTASQCFPEYYFSALSISTQRKLFHQIRAIPTGATAAANTEYETRCYELLRSALFPHLDFAAFQSRTETGRHIRDVIFHNDGKTDFLLDVRKKHNARQIVFELKNVKTVQTEDVNQLYRYLSGDFGQFGILLTRNPPPRNVIKNIVDLHSAKRVAILVLNDSDLELMINAQESGFRAVEVVKKKYIEFQRLLPC